MRDVRAHNQTAARRFLRRFKEAFTTRSDGSTWPKFDRTWKHADQYFRGLLRPGRRKSITGLATRMNADNERLERFVRESPWSPEAVGQHLREAVPANAQGPMAAVIVDGMGIPKKGDHSVGVTDQWCGASGSVDNCQVTINCTIARPGEYHNADQVTWPLGSRLYLPKEWTGEDASVYDDQQEQERYARLREDAGLPEEVGYQPKYDIAADLVEQVVDAVTEHPFVHIDETGLREDGANGLVWAFADPEHVVYEVDVSRSKAVPESVMDGYDWTAVVDGYPASNGSRNSAVGPISSARSKRRKSIGRR